MLARRISANGRSNALAMASSTRLSFEPMRKIGAWMPEEVKPLVAAKEAAVAFVEAAGHIERSDVWRNARQILRTDPTAALSELDALLSDKPAG